MMVRLGGGKLCWEDCVLGRYDKKLRIIFASGRGFGMDVW